MEATLTCGLLLLFVHCVVMATAQRSRFMGTSSSPGEGIDQTFLDFVCNERSSRDLQQAKFLCVMDHIPPNVRGMLISCLGGNGSPQLDKLCSGTSNLEKLNSCVSPSQVPSGGLPYEGPTPPFTTSVLPGLPRPEVTATVRPPRDQPDILQTNLPRPDSAVEQNEIASNEMEKPEVLRRMSRYAHMPPWFGMGNPMIPPPSTPFMGMPQGPMMFPMGPMRLPPPLPFFPQSYGTNPFSNAQMICRQILPYDYIM